MGWGHSKSRRLHIFDAMDLEDGEKGAINTAHRFVLTYYNSQIAKKLCLCGKMGKLSSSTILKDRVDSKMPSIEFIKSFRKFVFNFGLKNSK